MVNLSEKVALKFNVFAGYKHDIYEFHGFAAIHENFLHEILRICHTHLSDQFNILQNSAYHYFKAVRVLGFRHG